MYILYIMYISRHPRTLHRLQLRHQVRSAGKEFRKFQAGFGRRSVVRHEIPQGTPRARLVPEVPAGATFHEGTGFHSFGLIPYNENAASTVFSAFTLPSGFE